MGCRLIVPETFWIAAINKKRFTTEIAKALSFEQEEEF